MADVEVVTGDTRRFGYAVGTFASRTAVMSGSAVTLAARKAKEKALRVAADALEVAAADLEITGGMVQVKGDPVLRPLFEFIGAVIANFNPTLNRFTFQIWFVERCKLQHMVLDLDG